MILFVIELIARRRELSELRLIVTKHLVAYKFTDCNWITIQSSEIKI